MHQTAHAHSHHRSEQSGRALRVVLVLNAGYMFVEFFGGLWTGSLALIADAGHMLTDVAALARGAVRTLVRQAAGRSTADFWISRAETLAALLNGITLLMISVYVIYEAWHRLREPAPVDGGAMLVIATVGLVVNLGSAWMLQGGESDDLNRRGVYWHMMADALGSVGAIAAGVVVLLTGWTLADPLASVLIVLLILWGTWHLLIDSVNVLMQGTPPRISLEEIERAMRDVPGIVDVHDLHVWTLGAGNDVMTGHVVLAPDTGPTRSHEILLYLRQTMHDRFAIEHTTIQLEYEDLKGNSELCRPVSDEQDSSV